MVRIGSILSACSNGIKSLFAIKIPPKQNNLPSSISKAFDQIYFTTSNEAGTPQKRIRAAKTLIYSSQLLTIPSSVFGAALGVPLGVIAGLFTPKRERKNRLECIRQDSYASMQLFTKIFSGFTPSSWLGMGLAYLGEKCITSTGEYRANEKSSLTRAFELSHLVLSNNIPIRRLSQEEKDNTNQTLQEQAHNERHLPKTTRLCRAISRLAFKQPHAAKERIDAYLQNRKEELFAKLDPANDLEQLLEEVNHLNKIIDEAAQGNDRSLMLKINAFFSDGTEIVPPKNVPSPQLIDLFEDGSPVSTKITTEWLKGSSKEAAKRQHTAKELAPFIQKNAKEFSILTVPTSPMRVTDARPSYQGHLNVYYKETNHTTKDEVIPFELDEIEELEMDSPFELDVFIPFNIYTITKNGELPPDLKRFPSLAHSIQQGILNKKRQKAPLCHIVRNHQPAAKYNNNKLEPVKNAKPENIIIVDLPYANPQLLLHDDYAALSWQIANAEIKAFLELRTEAEEQYEERYPLQPLGIETSPAQHFSRAAAFFVETYLNDLPIAIPPNSPKEYIDALHFFQETLASAIHRGEDRQAIIKRIAEKAKSI